MTAEVITTQPLYYVQFTGDYFNTPYDYVNIGVLLFTTLDEAVTWMQTRVAEAVADTSISPEQLYPLYSVIEMPLTVGALPIRPPADPGPDNETA